MTLQGLLHWRLRRGLSQAGLARRSGLTQAGISQLERGIRAPSLRTVHRLCEVLDTTWRQLLERPEGFSFPREQADRLARRILLGGGERLRPQERELATAVGSLAIQKLRAHQVGGRLLYARSRWGAGFRAVRVRQLYGAAAVEQILKRLDALLAMRIAS